VQAETAARAIADGSRDEFWIKLQDSAAKTMAMLRLRLGARSRDPTARRRAGNAIKPGEERLRSSHLHAVNVDHDRLLLRSMASSPTSATARSHRARRPAC